jgi:hypothetical protein
MASAVTSFGTYAEDTPEWDRVKTCLDLNLAVLIRSNEPIDTIFRAARAICHDEIDNAVKQTLANIPAAESGPKIPSDVGTTAAFFNQRVDSALFAYAVKFKAVGGPTTLKY